MDRNTTVGPWGQQQVSSSEETSTAAWGLIIGIGVAVILFWGFLIWAGVNLLRFFS